MQADIPYAELHCLSNFSFLRAASHPQELVSRAAELGYQALAITDECSVAGVVRAWQEVNSCQLAIKLIVGAEFYLYGHNLVLLATNNRGYSQLCQLITRMRRRAEKGQYRAFIEDFNQEQTADCLCLVRVEQHKDILSLLKPLQQHYPNRLWLLADQALTNNDDDKLCHVKQLAEKLKLPVAASSHVVMHIPQRKLLHDCLVAIKENQGIKDILHRILPNAENHLRSLKKLQRLFPTEWLENTLLIAQRCDFKLDSICYRYPKDVLPGQYTAEAYLRQLVRLGMRRRFGKEVESEIIATIEKELTLINKKKYEHYFLTIYDIVKFARSQGILCQGRGSGANSVVCYCLGITEVNPREVSLLFERFISEGRHDPPDIDVDFEHERREEVIQYIYKKYGHKRAALAATVVRYKRKSALRDVAKALGIRIDLLDKKIANYGWRYHSKNWIDEMIDPGLGLAAAEIFVFKQLVQEILGFPRHLSQHVGGFVLTEGTVTELVPIENASMANRTVIQWDKDDLEALGLMKVDILALGMLTAVRKTLDYIRQFYDKPLAIKDMKRDDANVFRMIQKADTLGVFQIESRAQMSMLPRLKPTKFYDLVVQIAIVRPGPIHGDMVHPYLKRRLGKEPVDYPKAELKPVLERTFGVPIFQEQIIKLAMVAAGFSASEADELRRSMASWKKTGHMSQLRGKLTEKMLSNGYPEEFVARINRQIEGFGEYGFPESHAASFALITYVSCWLKYHYPEAFCCALLNSQPMGFYSPSQLVQDVQRHGIAVLPVCINHSQWDNCLEKQDNKAAIRLGFCRVKGMAKIAAINLILQRPTNGYQNLQALEQVPQLYQTDIAALASADALAAIAGHRFQARWQAAAIAKQDLLAGSFRASRTQLPPPSEFETLVEDYNSLGLTVKKHILQLLREQAVLPPTPTADQLLELANKAQSNDTSNRQEKIKIPISICGIVTARQRPKTSAGVTFVTLEDHTGNINVIVWLGIAQRYLKTLTTETLLAVRGFLEKSPDNDVVHVIAQELHGLSFLLADMQQPSRNYH